MNGRRCTVIIHPSEPGRNADACRRSAPRRDGVDLFTSGKAPWKHYLLNSSVLFIAKRADRRQGEGDPVRLVYSPAKAIPRSILFGWIGAFAAIEPARRSWREGKSPKPEPLCASGVWLVEMGQTTGSTRMGRLRAAAGRLTLARLLGLASDFPLARGAERVWNGSHAEAPPGLDHRGVGMHFHLAETRGAIRCSVTPGGIRQRTMHRSGRS
jgi:hypothetical protein